MLQRWHSVSRAEYSYEEFLIQECNKNETCVCYLVEQGASVHVVLKGASRE